MKIRERVLMLALAGGLVFGVAAVTAEDHDDHEHAQLGKAAPAFELPGIDGKTYKLADFKGKVVVLEWMNHECPFVVRAHDAKQMTGTFEKFKGKPVAWIGIDSSHFAVEKIDSIKKWAGEKGVNYPILLDPEGRIGHSYGARTTPHMYVIDKEGKLVYMGAPDDQGAPDGDGSRNYIEETVNALLSGSAVPVARTKSYGCSVKYRR